MLTTQNSISQGSCWRRGVAFSQGQWSWEKVFSSPKTNFEDCTWSWTFWGKESHLSSSLRKVARIIPATNPMHARSSAFCDLPLGIMLFTQFVHKITEGTAREEIWSSVNYVVFISVSLIYRKNQQVRQVLCDQRFGKCAGPEMSGAQECLKPRLVTVKLC